MIKRFPYHLSEFITVHSGTFAVLITYLERDEDVEEGGCDGLLGLPADMAYFIWANGRCAHCGASIARELNRCACGEPDDDEIHLEIEFSDEFNAPFRRVLAREKFRVTAFRRRQMLIESGGSYKKKDLVILYELQEARCYFCGEPFSTKSQGGSYHADHYIPISQGGKNDLSNLVLACPPCNFRKNAMDGDSFERIAKKMRRPEMGRKLGIIRRKVNAFRASYLDNKKNSGQTTEQ